jgi:hypothetical protein
VLYEGVLSNFLTRYSGLDPVWDEDRRSHVDGCVDLLIKWSESVGTIEVRLEHWAIREFAERHGGESSVAALEAAMLGPRRPTAVTNETERLHAAVEWSVDGSSAPSQ